MRTLKKPKVHNSYEFELDLAPLLAVMVKLVPVLLVSSAFVQMMVIETDLPQVVKDGIQAEEQKGEKEKLTSVQVEISKSYGFKILTSKKEKDDVQTVPLKSDKSFDFAQLHLILQKIKLENPEVFRVELAPDPDVLHKDIVKVMDEARKSRDKNVRFPVKDRKTGQETDTDYMFPNVVFVNMMET